MQGDAVEKFFPVVWQEKGKKQGKERKEGDGIKNVESQLVDK